MIENAKRDGVSVSLQQSGSQAAGQIRTATPGRFMALQVKITPDPVQIEVPLRYELLLNSKHSAEARHATVAHELGHLYCGHLGTPDARWWPDRPGLTHKVEEFEAESVCHLVCARLGIDNPSERYLSQYMENDIPPISLDCVMKAAGLIEQMGRDRLKPRKELK